MNNNQLSFSTDLFRKIIENSEDGIYIRDIDSRKIVWANNKFCEIHGVSSCKEIIGKDIRELLTEEGSRITFELDVHNVRKVELEARGPENQNITVQISSGILHGYLFGFVRDITEMKDAYKALEVSEKKYSTLVQAAQAGIMVVDPNENITLVNKAQAEMLGFEPEELVGRNLAELTTPEHFKFIQDKTIERKKGQFGFYETQLFCKDGSLKNIGVSVGPLIDKSGEYQGSLGVVTDLTEQLKYERMRNLFTQISRHELRNPLNIIKNSVNLLEKKLNVKDEALKELFLILNRNIRRLDKRVIALSDLGKIEQGLFSISAHITTSTEFRSIISSDIRAIKDSNRVKFKFIDKTEMDTQKEEFPLVFDSERILQVINNLIENALNHSSKDKNVDLEIIWEKKGVSILVEDFGAGIKRNEIHNIYEPFYTRETKYNKQGMGLGLFIIKNIVDLHKGSINVTSEVGKRTKFTLFIPTQA